jgi:nickel/cobalt exporter
MRLRPIILVFIGLVCFWPLLAEPSNPFAAGTSTQSARGSGSPGFAAALPLLKSISERLATLAGEVRTADTPVPLLVLGLFSLIYGVFHSLGPGHGKTIITTFFLSTPARLRHSVIAGYLLALVHSVSAIAVVLGVYFLLRGVFMAGFDNARRIVELLSYAVIVVIGAAMLWSRLRGREHVHRLPFLGPKGAPGDKAGHDHHHEDGHAQHVALSSQEDNDGRRTIAGWKDLVGITIAAGAVPCPGASTILLVCLSLDVMWAGITAVVMISAGMGLTVTAVGALAILARGKAIEASSRRLGPAARILRRSLEIGGSAALLLLGLFLFLGQVVG